MTETFTCQCLTDTLDGLCDGLSHFSHPSRAAVIYAVNADDPVRVYDPQNLLIGHELRFKELYLDSEQWRTDAPDFKQLQKHGHINPEKNIGLAGLISFGGRSRSLFYQMWFTAHHPDMCSVAPVERWLEHAAYRLSHDLGSSPEWYTAISGNFLREYATHAVRDCIVD
ncbi:MAG: DNA-binding protein, partial [Desulfobacterales bacterium]|nr:DNA-binding protein [Desulfobacterales bacterium]